MITAASPVRRMASNRSKPSRPGSMTSTTTILDAVMRVIVPRRDQPYATSSANPQAPPYGLSLGFVGSARSIDRAEPTNPSRSGGSGGDGVPDQRARHAVAATTTATELGTVDGDHLHTRVAQQGVGVGVPVVRVDDPGLDGDQVVAAVPLLPLDVVPAATRL